MKEAAPPPLLVGAKAIGRFLGLSARQVLYRVETGELPHIRMGRAIWAEREALQRWFKQRGAAR